MSEGLDVTQRREKEQEPYIYSTQHRKKISQESSPWSSARHVAAADQPPVE